MKNEHKSPEMLAINPMGMVPSMQYKGKPLSQTCAMLRFIAEEFPGGKAYYPDDVWIRAQVDMWLDWQATEVRLVMPKIVRPNFAVKGKDPSEIPAELKAQWHEDYKTFVSKVDWLE